MPRKDVTVVVMDHDDGVGERAAHALENRVYQCIGFRGWRARMG